MTFSTKEEYKAWVLEQDWYQTIELPSGITTPGKFPTQLRTPVFDTIDFKGKSVLDVGCNSGQHSFLAKVRGATRVVGVDVDEKRLNQARVLAEQEKLEATFEKGSIFDLAKYGQFDVVLCIAVLTEIEDFFGAVAELKKVIGEKAYIELALAEPLLYLSTSRQFFRGEGSLSRQKAVAEVREIKGGGLVISPTIEVLRVAFGPEFSIERKKGGVRYELVEITRV
jgi:SAM-dependent methyltransferase